LFLLKDVDFVVKFPQVVKSHVGSTAAQRHLAPQGVALAIRGPWALVLEAQRETLLHILPPPRECRGSVGQ